MRRFLLQCLLSGFVAETIYVALMVVTPPVFGQDTQAEEPQARSTVTAAPDEEPKAPSTSTEQTPNPGASAAPARQVPRAAPSPKGYSYRPTQKRPPAAQYSPLAAASGYAHSGVTPWQAIVNYSNAHHLNMGRLFAERKQAWLDNALYNQYFWYSFWVTGLLILSWFVIAWIHSDRHRATWELAECASDALRYSEYCKREAKEAIRRHNDHIEKCNRIIEDRRSGLMTTPETANLETFKQRIEQLTTEKQAAEFQNSRLTDELKSKERVVANITSRIGELESRMVDRQKNSSPNGTAGLVDRINRLESENRTLKEENQRIRQRQTKPRTAVAEELRSAE
jgi:hypothetical protein